MFPSVFPEKWVKFSYHLGLLNVSVINMLLPRMQASFGPYRWGKPRLGLGQSGQEPMCFSIIAASDRQGPRGSKWRKLESFIITLRSPLPPQQHLLAVLEGREHCYFVFCQSALPQAPWEARSTFQWCPHEWGVLSRRWKWWGQRTVPLPYPPAWRRGSGSPFPMTLNKMKKTESKITTHLPSPHLWFTEPFYWSGLRTACAHPSLGRKAAFPCVVSSLNFPPPSSPSLSPSRLCSCPSLTVDILYTVLRIMFNKLSKTDSMRREMYLRFNYRLRNLEANVTKISVQYIDHWIQWPPNLPSCRPLVVLPRVVSIEWWGETP